ncbi:MAG: hypothetical protein R3A44_44290 [Caldilineaceae bacterium]
METKQDGITIQAGDAVYWGQVRFTRKMRRLITTYRGRWTSYIS